MARRAVDNSALIRWRTLDSVVVLRVVADHVKQDTAFKPTRSRSSTRWHVSVAGRDYELLCNGPKFFDTRASRGGGGALDLVMHLFRIDFQTAVSVLRDKGF